MRHHFHFGVYCWLHNWPDPQDLTSVRVSLVALRIKSSKHLNLHGPNTHVKTVVYFKRYTHDTMKTFWFCLYYKASLSKPDLPKLFWGTETRDWYPVGSVLPHWEKVPLQPWLSTLLVMCHNKNTLWGRYSVTSTSFAPYLFLLGWLKMNSILLWDQLRLA